MWPSQVRTAHGGEPRIGSVPQTVAEPEQRIGGVNATSVRLAATAASEQGRSNGRVPRGFSGPEQPCEQRPFRTHEVRDQRSGGAGEWVNTAGQSR